jgi:uncharacterized protein (DUF2249 family)
LEAEEVLRIISTTTESRSAYQFEGVPDTYRWDYVTKGPRWVVTSPLKLAEPRRRLKKKVEEASTR